MNEAQIRQFVPIFQKLEIFKGLTPEEIQRLLSVCRSLRHEAGNPVYRRGEPADEMFILVQGTLSVISPAGAELAEIEPGMSIGEMGLFTGEPRSADIVAASPALGFGVRKRELDALLNLDREMKVKVQQNVIRLLAARLRETNTNLDRCGDTIERLRKRIEKLVGLSEEDSGEAGGAGPRTPPEMN